MTATLDNEVADLRRANAELQRRLDEAVAERDEAQQRENATAEVLHVINSSPGNLQPVFDAMVQKAITLCDAVSGQLWTCDGERFDPVAVGGVSRLAEWLLQLGPRRAAPDTPGGRLLSGERIVHIADVRQDPAYRAHPLYREMSDIENARTFIAVGLRKEDTLLGMITVYRQDVRPFSDKEIALLQNFAAQAVIAMENARLLTETREALEQQTATAEVLQVINSSPGELEPVFDAMLEKAVELCSASFGLLMRYDGDFLNAVAHYNSPPQFAEFLRTPVRPAPGMATYRILRGEDVVTFADVAADRSYSAESEAARRLVELSGARSHLTAALRKDGVLLGVIVIYRQEVLPFTEREVALVKNFAAQAVIAMENARLITETREALEQQTATAEVLQVINSSPGNLAPVFEAMLEKGVRLSEASFGVLCTFDGDCFKTVATYGVPPLYADHLSREPLTFAPGSGPASILTGQPFHTVLDLAADPLTLSGDPTRRALVELGGARSGAAVPLRKESALLGVFLVFRPEVKPFSDKQIALLQNFAAQAVIAMENARLITETREALEQQTATAEVLQVINSSPGDLAPVFDAILEKAHNLCDAAVGTLGVYDGETWRAVAQRGYGGPLAQHLQQRIRGSDNPFLQQLLDGARLVHVPDLAQIEHPIGKANVGAGHRTLLVVPLRKDNALLGTISTARREVRPFSDKEIALLENFAAQAVIAMENARLLDEIRQRQRELRVTFDNMVDGVAMFDEALHLAAWNRNFQELLQLPDELLAKRHDFDTYIRYLTERGEFGETDPETQIKRLRARIGDHYSFERTRPDGTVIEVRHNPMPDGGVVLIYSDITERKRSEAEIREARDAAEAAYRDLKAAQASLIQAEKMASLGQLTAGIAHEIKNPLNFVNNFAGLSVELLDELKETAAPAITALSDERRAEIDESIELLTGNLEKIAEHGRRADNIVKSMLEHSRGSSGDRRSVDLNSLVEEALNLAYHGGRAQDQSFNVTLVRDFADAIAPIELVPQDITRLCLNLFSNGFYAATKRQREGSDANFKPTLKVSTRDLGDAVEVRIRDNGTGISPEIRDKLFQPFFTTKPTGEGTGLGLSISYDIVTQQHGGAIDVDSRVGEFTEFTVRLPRGRRATMAEAAS